MIHPRITKDSSQNHTWCRKSQISRICPKNYYVWPVIPVLSHTSLMCLYVLMRSTESFLSGALVGSLKVGGILCWSMVVSHSTYREQQHFKNGLKKYIYMYIFVVIVLWLHHVSVNDQTSFKQESTQESSFVVLSIFRVFWVLFTSFCAIFYFINQWEFISIMESEFLNSDQFPFLLIILFTPHGLGQFMVKLFSFHFQIMAQQCSL